MQPHSILHSLIQTYHEYLLDGMNPVTEIPKVRRIQSPEPEQIDPSFELYFDISHQSMKLPQAAGNQSLILRSICVEFLNAYIGDIPPYLPLQTYLHHIAFLIPEYEIEAFPLLCETMEENVSLTIDDWLERSQQAIQKNLFRTNSLDAQEQMDSEETLHIDNTIDDEADDFQIETLEIQSSTYEQGEDIDKQVVLASTEENTTKITEENTTKITEKKATEEKATEEKATEIEATWDIEGDITPTPSSFHNDTLMDENQVTDSNQDDFDDDEDTIRRISVNRDLHVSWQVGFDTHIGVRKAWVSQTNQDCFFFDRYQNSAILLVADGISISSAGSGDVASNITAQTVAHFWSECKETLIDQGVKEIREFLLRTLIHANQEICRIAEEFVEDITSEIPMGTTVLLAYCRGHDVWLANLGDSRAYVVMEHGLGILVGDQNLLGEKLRHHIPLDLNDNFKALIRYLGHFDAEWRPALQMPDIRHVRLMRGESLLLCSDGLTDYASDTHHGFQKLAMPILQDSQKTLFQKSYHLTALANNRGGGDNITVLLAKPEETDFES